MMTQDEAKKIIKEIHDVRSCIQTTNHKLDQHMDDSAKHWEKTCDHMKEMEPLRDALRFVTTFQRFLKWGGLTLAVALGYVYWLIKKT